MPLFKWLDICITGLKEYLRNPLSPLRLPRKVYLFLELVDRNKAGIVFQIVYVIAWNPTKD